MVNKYVMEQDAQGIPYLVAEGSVSDSQDVLSSPSAVWEYLSQDGIRLPMKAEEHVYMLALDFHNRIKGVFELSHGTMDMAPVSSRMVMTRALLFGASAAKIILVHNHPSDRVSPSKPDRELCQTIWEAGRLMNVELLDFIIVGSEGTYSFQENGEIPC